MGAFFRQASDYRLQPGVIELPSFQDLIVMLSSFVLRQASDYRLQPGVIELPSFQNLVGMSSSFVFRQSSEYRLPPGVIELSSFQDLVGLSSSSSFVLAHSHIIPRFVDVEEEKRGVAREKIPPDEWAKNGEEKVEEGGEVEVFELVLHTRGSGRTLHRSR